MTQRILPTEMNCCEWLTGASGNAEAALNLLSSAELMAGVALIVLWPAALRLCTTDKPLSSVGFVLRPSILLMWIVGALVLVGRGAGLI